MRIVQFEFFDGRVRDLPFRVNVIVETDDVVETAQFQLAGIVDRGLQEDRTVLPIEREIQHVDFAEGNELLLVRPSNIARADSQDRVLHL